MPELDEHQVLQEICQWEGKQHITDDDGVKVVMVNTLYDVDDINQAFRERCLEVLHKLRLMRKKDGQ